MLYLAEVQKQKSGFMGAGKAEIKLLAFQRADQSWNPVPGDEMIPAEEANNLSSGALVLADVNANRQVQRIQEAGRPLVSILQNFSRHIEKSKRQEEEIEQWKQSLTYQSQELNRRNMEMEARLEQMQQMENDSKHLELKRQEVDGGRETVERLQAEIERNRRELEGAWEHLRGEQRRLAEQQTELQTKVLNEVQTRQIQELLDRLSSGFAPTEAVWEQLNFSSAMVATQQGILSQHWQQFEQQRSTAQQQQEEVDHKAEALQNSLDEWQLVQNSWEQASSDLKVQASMLSSKQEYARMLSLQVRNQEELYQQIYRLREPFDNASISQKVDLEALEKMPLEQLQQIVQDLQRDLKNASHFVNEQEEELKLQQQTIDELQAKLNQANDNDRANLATELADERDSYQFLNETLVGQRQNLREREAILSQHSSMMGRRQGVISDNGQEDNKIDLKPILIQIEKQRQQQTQELQRLEQEIEQMIEYLKQEQGMLNVQADEQEVKRQELQSLEQNLRSLRAATAECWGRVNLYQEILQPGQDSLDGLQQKLEAIASNLEQEKQTGNYQLQTIDELRSSLLSVIPNPVAVS